MHVHAGAFGWSGDVAFGLWLNGTTNTLAYIKTLPSGYALYGSSDTTSATLQVQWRLHSLLAAWCSALHCSVF